MATTIRNPLKNADGDCFTYRPCILIKTDKEVIYSESKMNESDYMNLNNGIWSSLREQRLNIDGYKCAKCGAAYPLVIHHVRYPAIWGEENITDLLTLCRGCHDEVHGRQKGE